ncbi:MAG: galactose mutarotase [Bacteroidales bacterium]|jgi:aldose 1-epimerase|nr:galactose mutarotase [Bacteroidales bacterium]MCI1784839.1 galactose mutarotase [Bacteroidales bacterium]
MDIKKEQWGVSGNGKEISRYTLTNSKGAFIRLSDVGAGIVSAAVPDRDGKIADVVLGYQNPADYFSDGPCAGKCPGRYANRIAKGRFVLDGKEYNLPINNACNHLHGGPDGFQNQVWESRVTGDAVEFMYFSADGEAGYPGNLKVVAHYEWTEENEIKLTFRAVTDASTILNLTNHTYFNLNGEGNGGILGHILKLNASLYLPTDDTLIPLGSTEPVAGTPMDFLEPKVIGQDIKEDFPALKYGKGYDNCFMIDDYSEGQLQNAAQLYSEESGRVLDVITTQPAVQVYTGNWLEGSPKGKCGRSYHDYEGVAIECQHCPDSPNEPDFPSTVLRPGEEFRQAIIFSFSVKE